MVRQILGAFNQILQFYREGICRILPTIFWSTSDPTQFFCWITTYSVNQMAQTSAHLLLPLQESNPNPPQCGSCFLFSSLIISKEPALSLLLLSWLTSLLSTAPKKNMRSKPSLARWGVPSGYLQLFLPVLLSASVVVVVAPRGSICKTESVSMMLSPSIPTRPKIRHRCKAHHHSSRGTSQGPSHLHHHPILVPLVWVVPRRYLIMFHPLFRLPIVRPQQQRLTLLTIQNP